MINKKYLWPIFGIMIIIQLYIPANMIWESESTIRNGKAFKFKTQPVDPYDPFRGKYIDLRYEIEQLEYEIDDLNSTDQYYRKNAYATIETKSDGFAAVKEVSVDPDNLSGDYIPVNISRTKNGMVNISIPFRRYYMEESIAKPTELYVQKIRRDSTATVYGIINIKNGTGVLTSIMINDRAIEDVVREDLAK